MHQKIQELCMLLGAAKILSEMKDEINGEVWIF